MTSFSFILLLLEIVCEAQQTNCIFLCLVWLGLTPGPIQIKFFTLVTYKVGWKTSQKLINWNIFFAQKGQLYIPTLARLTSFKCQLNYKCKKFYWIVACTVDPGASAESGFKFLLITFWRTFFQTMV
jgi:hypothetical protein